MGNYGVAPTKGGRAGMAALVILFLVAIPTTQASAAVCGRFEVGTQKWQQCVERAARGGGTEKKGETPDPNVVCSEFQVGSSKWQQCVIDAATGGVGGTIDTGVACSEFQVGSSEWTKCIQDSATGGGLMPWIVVIPLGVMLVGMAVMFAIQARNRRKGYSSARVGSTAGGWLIFMAFIEGSIGAGMAVGESRASGSGGGFGIAATVLIGTAIILLLVGIVVVIKSARKRRIEESGQSGKAKVITLSQTGTYINQNPVFEFDLEIEVLGISPYRAEVRATVPMYLVQRVGPGATLPVKVDPSKPSEVIIDWAPMTVAPSSVPATPWNPS